MSNPTEKLAQLSTRELQVFERIAKGMSPAKIAEELGLSVKTVSTYRARILEKTGARSNAELATLRAQAALDAAADHSLVAAAFVAGVAEWKPFATEKHGELCVNDLRHCTHLDEHGVPVLTTMLRVNLTAALHPVEPELEPEQESASASASASE